MVCIVISELVFLRKIKQLSHYSPKWLCVLLLASLIDQWYCSDFTSKKAVIVKCLLWSVRQFILPQMKGGVGLVFN